MPSEAKKLDPPFEVVCDSADREAWLAARRTGIGASDMPIIMGASQWDSILSVYYEKTGELEPEEEGQEDEWLLWGRLLEDQIRGELARRAEVSIKWPAPLIRSTIHPWALATPDGLTADGEPVEAKNLSWGYDAEEWAEHIPQKYFIQCQQQMLVSGAQRCLFGALLWGSRLIWEWVPRDEITIKQIIAAGAEFWRRVETRDTPLSDGHPNARKAIGRLALVPSPLEIPYHAVEELLASWEVAEKDLGDARAAEKRAKRQRDAVVDEIALSLEGHRQAFTHNGWTFAWSESERAGYTVKPTTIKKFTINAPKLLAKRRK